MSCGVERDFAGYPCFFNPPFEGCGNPRGVGQILKHKLFGLARFAAKLIGLFADRHILNAFGFLLREVEAITAVFFLNL